MNDAPPLRLVVAGLWHLGSVTAACCARHFRVIGLDLDAATVAALNQGRPPLFEPGLVELTRAGLEGGRLQFTTDPKRACHDATILWVCG
jgi:UDPglucose 6-dehydrogenase